MKRASRSVECAGWYKWWCRRYRFSSDGCDERVRCSCSAQRTKCTSHTVTGDPLGEKRTRCLFVNFKILPQEGKTFQGRLSDWAVHGGQRWHNKCGGASVL